ncbi:MAG: MarR family transcriptional regulator [Azonexus sp.]|jgi:DNA-binding MarR family transcriptional regulator|nr:MarR family transcriptional regulator [Azonexus sp.]
MKDLTTEKTLASMEIADRLFFRFFQAANTVHTKGTQALEQFGVTTQQWSVMGALSQPQAAGGMSVNDLTRFLLVSRQNLTGLLNRLERDGIVEKHIGSTDRRSRTVRLTKAGEELWLAMQEPIHSFYDEVLKDISFDDRLSFIHYIGLLQRNMTKI